MGAWLNRVLGRLVAVDNVADTVRNFAETAWPTACVG